MYNIYTVQEAANLCIETHNAKGRLERNSNERMVEELPQIPKLAKKNVLEMYIA